jgi:glycosyltransferase involved in cell wall biosynthesis
MNASMPCNEVSMSTAHNTDLPAVSVVIIGRNEMQNIRACIDSVLRMDYPAHLIEVLYVDTGSEDGTPDIARSTGIRVIEESGGSPSAALGRNRGLAEASHGIIHFVDGDMVVAPDYLKKVSEVLQNRDIACVFGRVVERHAETNWISRVLNIDWKRKQAGFIESPGGGGTFRRTALEQIGGYNSNLRVAEETDLGIRMRRMGYKIYMINDVMAQHDYGVNTISDLIRRYYNLGKCRFNILTSGAVPRALKSWALALPKQALLALSLMLLMLLCGYFVTVIAFIFAYPAVYAVLVLIRDRRQIMKRGVDIDAFLHSYLYYLMKPVILLGMVKEALSCTLALFSGREGKGAKSI